MVCDPYLLHLETSNTNTRLPSRTGFTAFLRGVAADRWRVQDTALALAGGVGDQRARRDLLAEASRSAAVCFRSVRPIAAIVNTSAWRTIDRAYVGDHLNWSAVARAGEVDWEQPLAGLPDRPEVFDQQQLEVGGPGPLEAGPSG